jgi:hypothetical protein
MQSMRYFLFLVPLFILSCSTPPSTDNVVAEPAPEEVIDVTQLTEELPDSGILKGVDPEQIMTDDWSDDGDIELEIEEQ